MDDLFSAIVSFSGKIIPLRPITCAQGLIFPSDWEIVTNTREQISHEDPALLNIAREILQSSKVAHEIVKAWEAVLSQPKRA